MPEDRATLSCGCFWGVQARFDVLEGVIKTKVGYTGGHTQDPCYEQVCRGETGHAEAIEILYISEILTFEALLTLFFQTHDPTTYHQQGPDIGSQYRSAIFYHTEQQKKEAFQMLNKMSPHFSHQIVTEIKQASEFYPAEEYHQYYYKKHPNACY